MDKNDYIKIFNESKSKTEICKKIYGKKNGSTFKKLINLFNELEYDFDEMHPKNKDTKICLECGEKIKSKNGRKFCSCKCAAIYNNRLRGGLTKETKLAISNGLIKYNNNLTDVEKWKNYCKRFKKDVSFEYYVENIKNSSHNHHKLRRRKGENSNCVVCGSPLSGYRLMFCSKHCYDEYNDSSYKEYIKRWKNGEELGHTPSFKIHKYVKRYLMEKNNNSCQECGWNKENKYTHKVPLQIHHIDGDCTNNKEENLQLLCPNCHALTENFGSRNKNSKRVFRRQKMFYQDIIK